MLGKNLMLASVFSIAAIALSVAAHAMTFRTLYSFCAQRDCIDGRAPRSGVTLDDAGNLYGATYVGGDRNLGVLFMLRRNSGDYTYSRLYSFCSKFFCSDGERPDGDLVIDGAGNLYGTAIGDTDKNCGMVFEFAPRGGGTYKVLHAFACSEGKSPVGLSYVGAGAPYDGTSSLYGVTMLGGAYNGGVVYQLTPGNPTWTAKVLHTFCLKTICPDGKTPVAKLLPVSRSLLYGTTLFGGANDEGTVFELRQSGRSWSETVLHDFCSEQDCQDGHYAYGGVFQDRGTGDLFGMAHDSLPLGGGGVAYKLANDGSSYQVIHKFCSEQNCADGLGPVGELRRKDGTFFGVTEGGGGDGAGGTVFQLRYVHGHWVLTTLHSFPEDCSAGCEPVQQQLAMDADGNLFGTTLAGGQADAGTVFELSP